MLTFIALINPSDLRSTLVIATAVQRGDRAGKVHHGTACHRGRAWEFKVNNLSRSDGFNLSHRAEMSS